MKGVTYTNPNSKRRLREGQPMSMRNTKPTGQRPYDADVNIDSPAYKYLIKALQALGGTKADTRDILNGKYHKDSEMVAELWNLATSNRDDRIQILGEGLNGTVSISRSGQVYTQIVLDFGHTMPYSVSRIFKECGFKIDVTNSDGVVRNSQYRTRNVSSVPNEELSKEALLNSINMNTSIEEAAKMFNKLVKKLAKANPSYDETSSYKTPEEYYRAKGEIAGDVTVGFEICRDTDGSEYITGTLLKNQDDEWTAIIADGYNSNEDDGEYHEYLRGACEDICQIFSNFVTGRDSYFEPSKALRSLPRNLIVKDLAEAKKILKTLVEALNIEIDNNNDQLDPDDDDCEEWWDHLYIEFKAPEEDEQTMNANRQKKVAKMQKQKAYDDAHRFESVQRHLRMSLRESSQWNKESNPYAKAAFDAVFNLIDQSYIDMNELDSYDDEMEAEYGAENNEMIKNVLQGIYHALEQFVPQVDEIFGPDGVDIIFGDEVYAIAAN